MAEPAEPYEVYVDRYCRVKSGQKLTLVILGLLMMLAFKGLTR